MTTFEQRYHDARRKVIARDFPHLNDMQLEAVLTTEGPLLLLAGAGSGKTTVLINRIANLLKYGRGSDCLELPAGAGEVDLEVLERAAGGFEQLDPDTVRRLCAVEPVEPWRIIAITFTNKAADELKDRLAAMLGDDAGDIWAKTFHSACVRILSRDADRLGFNSRFTIYDTSDSQSVMRSVLRELDIDEKMLPHKNVLNQISKAKDALISAESYLEEAQKNVDVRKKQIGLAYVAYAKRLREASAMDFDDLIYYTVRLLLDNEDIREYWQRRFRYVLIDEYQDTNNLQYILASTLAGGYENICVVGDDDQSIYKFRGATIENIMSFEAQYKSARVIKLERNYRSSRHILDAANAVISRNSMRKGKRLWTERDAGDKLLLYRADNEYAEAQFVASRIVENFSQGGSWNDNAVLYRMNAQSNQLEYAFKRAGIPYRVIGGMRFFDRAEIKDMLAYLWVIANPADSLRVSRIVNSPARGIGKTTIEYVAQIEEQENIPMLHVMRTADKYSLLQRASLKLRQFAILIDELRESSRTLPLDELYDEIIEKTGYITALEAKDTDESRARIENVRELKTNILSFLNENPQGTLDEFLFEIALYTDLDQLEEGADYAVMMTMHSAKGLEFPNVFIVGAEEGIFPGTRTLGMPDEMEEERRLCYVAMTRAKSRLYITCAGQRTLFGQTSVNSLSRFVDEIPEESIDRPYSPVSRSQQVPGGPVSRTHADKTRLAAPSGGGKQPLDFKLGDSVNHKAFGLGTITKLTPMGGDALVEIEFESEGVKRLMLRISSQHMTKV